MASIKDLKSCPHCGGVKLRIDDNDSGLPGDYPDTYWVICLSCFASGGPGATREKAVENWNKRTV